MCTELSLTFFAIPPNPLCCCCLFASGMSDSVQPYGLQHARLLCPWDSLAKGTRVSFHALLQGIKPPSPSFQTDFFTIEPHQKWLIHRQRYLIKSPWSTAGPRFLAALGGCCSSCLVAKLCPTFCDCMDYSLVGSSVHGISQARILEWIAISFSRGSSLLRYWTPISWMSSWILYHWAASGALWGWGDTNCSPGQPK